MFVKAQNSNYCIRGRVNNKGNGWFPRPPDLRLPPHLGVQRGDDAIEEPLFWGCRRAVHASERLCGHADCRYLTLLLILFGTISDILRF